ncbi:flagellar hook-associated protein FlgK [Sporomusa acidovorans]|uniref:Flagellar hook-associated protein 1 n=1 Tax=Sporomusa acidovorans (strain ATCC 49682 / DSM 3132 / Mol) TaxID=1123286 RepID=A0ABZ3IY69_SPOA4|nr:flagellar hook-associated protein FlgK [Sporomusa acidovorans]OZC22410.1 flagellar hook-associated protein 1 [Sporomusa acidovorans DSM 3132]SDE48467.1 flagellar hook-associated protein 1 FlgK [Sporomusa acidovorans]
MSTFGTYSIAYSGMYTNQAALTTTSTNLANVDTTGASKVQLTSADASTTRSDGSVAVSGVTVESITRSRDIYLDSTYRTENADSAYLAVKSGNLEYMDTILSEYDTVTTDDDGNTTTTEGVQDAISDFFSAWEKLSTSTTTSSQTDRVDVVDAGKDLLEKLVWIDEKLQELQEDAVNSVQDGVDSLNDYAAQVAELNAKITLAEAGGGEASYLRDQRDALLDEMSALANISVSEQNDGSVTVTLDGKTLVKGDSSKTLVVEGDGSTDNPLKVTLADSGDEVDITSGSIGAYLEDADQTGYETIDTSDLPYSFTTGATSSISTMRQALNDLVTTLATKINSLTTSGVDLNGDTGLAFFTTIDSNEPLSITNIQVNPELVSDSDKVVTSASGGTGDYSIADAIYDLASDTSCYESDGSSLDIIDFYTALTTWLGTEGDTVASNYETQAALVSQLDYQRQAVSAISIDEEMSNMIKFQTAYAASAQVMNTVDSMIESLLAVF